VNGCDDCLLTFSVFREETGSESTFSRIKEIYNGYNYASPELREVVSACEKAIRDSVAENQVSKEMYVDIVKHLRLAPTMLGAWPTKTLLQKKLSHSISECGFSKF